MKEIYDVRFTSEGTKNARGHTYKTDISRALTTNAQDPSHNHGGCAIVQDFRGGIYSMTTGNYMTVSQDQTSTLLSRDYKDPQCVSYHEQHYIVRRLTPLECERLQGFPDYWTDIGDWEETNGKTHAEATDSPRYKALGNSIAIPPWYWVLRRLSLCCGSDATMASLFDGIGGFPLIWETINGEGTCLWASEIEEFPMAVTRKHFKEDAADNENY